MGELDLCIERTRRLLRSQTSLGQLGVPRQPRSSVPACHCEAFDVLGLARPLERRMAEVRARHARAQNRVLRGILRVCPPELHRTVRVLHGSMPTQNGGNRNQWSLAKVRAPAFQELFLVPCPLPHFAPSWSSSCLPPSFYNNIYVTYSAARFVSTDTPRRSLFALASGTAMPSWRQMWRSATFRRSSFRAGREH
jgi:hypothetical protein